VEGAPFATGFGRYRLVRRIASGGMGDVYRAVAQGLGDVEKAVAIKLLKPELAKDPDFVRMFEEEAKVSFLLGHTNVVQTFDVGRIDDRYFIAMELVDGMTLATLLDRCRGTLGQPLPFRHALTVASESLRGLDYAHRAKDGNGRALGIIHRDVSPTNVFVSSEGEVKVGDFGIALSALRSSRSRAGTVKGKLSYMPPEQLRGEPLDARADVYAVGAVLYEMLTMRAPFFGGGMELIPLVLEGIFPRPRERVPEIPEELEKIVLGAMAKDRENRPESAHAMRDRIERFAMSQGWPLSTSAFAEFVRRVGEEPETSDPGFGDALAREIRRVGGAPGQLSVFTSLADARILPSGTEVVHGPGPTPGALPHHLARGEAGPHQTADVPPLPRRGPAAAFVALGAAVLVVGGVTWFALAGEETTEVRVGPAPATSAPLSPATPTTALAFTARPTTSAPVSTQPATARTVPQGTARLTINSDPWAEVFLGRRSLGTTPIMSKEVPSGRHVLRLVHAPLGLEKTQVVTLEPGEARTLVIRLGAQ